MTKGTYTDARILHCFSFQEDDVVYGNCYGVTVPAQANHSGLVTCPTCNCVAVREHWDVTET
jgi:hypothetical protein